MLTLLFLLFIAIVAANIAAPFPSQAHPDARVLLRRPSDRGAGGHFAFVKQSPDSVLTPVLSPLEVGSPWSPNTLLPPTLSLASTALTSMVNPVSPRSP